jgi:hypothetical protein
MEDDLRDEAIDDLVVLVAQTRDQRDDYRKMLETIGRRVNGWTADHVSDEQLRMVSLQIDVMANQYNAKIEILEQRIADLTKAVERRKRGKARHRARA